MRPLIILKFFRFGMALTTIKFPPLFPYKTEKRQHISP